MFGGPGGHRVALDEVVGILAREAFFDQGQQDGLGIPHAQRQAQISLHVLRINDQAVHQFGKRDEHVIEQGAGIRKDNALDGAVADVALVPEGHIFQRSDGVAAQHASQAAEPFARDRIRLCGIALDPFWPAAKNSSASRTSVR